MIEPTALPGNIHFIGIGGRLVGGLAMALQKLGVKVTGSDDRLFPPMSELLAAEGISANVNWAVHHVSKEADAVVTGGLVSDDNPELQAARQLQGVPIWNATAFLEHYFLQHSQNIVVTGTKGKTTTTAMLAWIMDRAGISANHFVGGHLLQGEMPMFRLNKGPLCILEGDEYPCSTVDSSPKMWRYHPHDLVVTNVSHDHLDIFPTPESYSEIFQQACMKLPRSGSLVLNADDPGAMRLASFSNAQVMTFGFASRTHYKISAFRSLRTGCRFQIKGVPFRLPMSGPMNARNAAAAAVAASIHNVSLAESADALAYFPGLSAHQEILARIGRSIVYADQAYHPVAIRALLESLKLQHPGRRLLVIIDPCNTGGLNGVRQSQLPDCLKTASSVVVCPAYALLPPAQPFDHFKLCRDLENRGVSARTGSTYHELFDQAQDLWQDGDIVLISLPPGFSDATNRFIDAFSSAHRKKSTSDKEAF